MGCYILELFAIGDLYEIVSAYWKSTRELNDREQKSLKDMFGNAINADLVRIDNKARIISRQQKIAYVSFFTVNSWGDLADQAFIHEMVHVWQYERLGAAYIPLALLAQHSQSAYNYGGVDSLKKAMIKGQKLSSFNIEQQAEIIADYYKIMNPGKSKRQLESRELVSVYKYFGDQLMAAV